MDLSQLLTSANAGIFTVLRDPAVFAKVAVEDGVVTWPGEVDRAPDATSRGRAARWKFHLITRRAGASSIPYPQGHAPTVTSPGLSGFGVV